jgi:SAM-dependent methyltransferase
VAGTSALYDAVCAFQVLEHVVDPGTFIENCLRRLRKGGLLLISVPDSNGFLRHAKQDILNAPPHHLSLWHRQVLRHMSGRFPLRIRRLVHEPLAPYHLKWYANVQMERLPWIRYVTGPLIYVIRRGIVPLVRLTGTCCLWPGHSWYACYEKL